MKLRQVQVDQQLVLVATMTISHLSHHLCYPPEVSLGYHVSHRSSSASPISDLFWLIVSSDGELEPEVDEDKIITDEDRQEALEVKAKANKAFAGVLL
jgi:hypothetical protein